MTPLLQRLLRIVMGVLLCLAPCQGHSQTPSDVPCVRQDVSQLTPKQIASLRKGVKVMKERSKKNPDDPTGWDYQAAIHGTPTTPAKDLWNQCQHGTYYFLAWHRAYVYYFERILRSASGDPTLTLPYWNYTLPTQRGLPQPFRQPATKANSLFVQERDAQMNDGALLPDSAVQYSAAFRFTNFTAHPPPVRGGGSPSFGGNSSPTLEHSFSPHGQLESQPHDVIHDLVGGTDSKGKAGWMSNPDTAAQDPLFWVHHANIDRLWKRWLDQGGGRANPITDSTWMNTSFSFYDEQGKQVSVAIKDLLNTEEDLGYRYDDDPPQHSEVRMASSRVDAADTPAMASAQPTVPEVLAQSTAPVTLGQTSVRVQAPIQEAAQPKFQKLLTADVVESSLILNVEGIQFDTNPGIYYELYLDLPEGQAQPDPHSVYYVGNLGFFGLKPHAMNGEHEGHAMPEAPAFKSYDITAQVRDLKAKGAWREEQFTVTLVPRGRLSASTREPLPVKPNSQATLARVSISRP